MDGRDNRTTTFGGDGIVVATLKLPAALNPAGSDVAIVEAGDVATSRKAWFSKSKCGAAPSLETWSPYVTVTNKPTMYYSPTVGTFTMLFQPNETWYLMVRNQKRDGSSSCVSGTCNVTVRAYVP